jgi:recombination protein RecR
MQNAEPLENLADQFARFPGIGRKGAVRMAYEVMSMSNEQAMELAKAIENAKVKLHRCRLCQDYTANEVQHLRFPQTGPLRDLRGGIPAGCKSH